MATLKADRGDEAGIARTPLRQGRDADAHARLAPRCVVKRRSDARRRAIDFRRSRVAPCRPGGARRALSRGGTLRRAAHPKRASSAAHCAAAAATALVARVRLGAVQRARPQRGERAMRLRQGPRYPHPATGNTLLHAGPVESPCHPGTGAGVVLLRAWSGVFHVPRTRAPGAPMEMSMQTAPTHPCARGAACWPMCAHRRGVSLVVGYRGARRSPLPPRQRPTQQRAAARDHGVGGPRVGGSGAANSPRVCAAMHATSSRSPALATRTCPMTSLNVRPSSSRITIARVLLVAATMQRRWSGRRRAPLGRVAPPRRYRRIAPSSATVAYPARARWRGGGASAPAPCHSPSGVHRG